MARAFVAELCARWDFMSLCDDVVLPVSELVANSLLHAGSAATITVSLSEGMLEVAVHDDSERKPIVRPAREDLAADIDAVISRGLDDPVDLSAPAWHSGEAGSIAGGRGMIIVDALADEWGVRQLADGKDVWFRMRAPEPLRYACPCPGSHIRTPGGMPVRRR